MTAITFPETETMMKKESNHMSTNQQTGAISVQGKINYTIIPLTYKQYTYIFRKNGSLSRQGKSLKIYATYNCVQIKPYEQLL